MASLDRRIVMKVNNTELSDKSDKTSINRHKCPIEVPCKTHPDAPHGFNRNASHAEGRYVCDCEHWEPEEN